MDDEENPNTRLLALSDGVIAVAITLLVLDIRLPEGFGEFDDARLWPRWSNSGRECWRIC